MQNDVYATVIAQQVHPRNMPETMLLEANAFATVQMSVIRATCPSSGELEAEWHQLFEEAISDRVRRVSYQRHVLATSHALPAIQQRSTDRVPVLAHTLACLGKGPFWQRYQSVVIRICMIISLLLLGFDAMGLLVLSHLR